MNISKTPLGATTCELSDTDRGRLRRGCEVLEKLAFHGRSGGHNGLSAEFLRTVADDVAKVLEASQPPIDAEFSVEPDAAGGEQEAP